MCDNPSKAHRHPRPNNHSVPHFPEQDAKLRATSLSVRRGGNCGNSLEVLQQFLPPAAPPAPPSAATETTRPPSPPSPPHITPHLVSTLPARQSAATAQVLSSFGPDTPVGLGRCIHREDHTEAASSYILHDQETGSRTVVNHSGLAEMTVGELVGIADGFRGLDDAETWWHFEVRVDTRQSMCPCFFRFMSGSHHPSPYSRVMPGGRW